MRKKYLIFAVAKFTLDLLNVFSFNLLEFLNAAHSAIASVVIVSVTFHTNGYQIG